METTEIITNERLNVYNELLMQAQQVALNAYTPYSKFNVGAAILYESGKVYTGCNVENASYGLTLCAERNALSTAIADGEKSKPVIVAIFSPNSADCYPCGACRQWIAEFASDAEIVVQNAEGNPVMYTIGDLLPKTFYL